MISTRTGRQKLIDGFVICFHQFVVEIDAQTAGSVEHHGFVTFLREGLPFRAAGQNGLAGLGKGYPRATHVFLQPLGILPHIGDGHHVHMVEHEGDIRAVPGQSAAVDGEFLTEHIIVHGGLALVDALEQEMLALRADAGLKVHQVRDGLVGIGLAEAGNQPFGILAEAFFQRHQLLGLGHAVLMGQVHAEGEFADHRAHHHRNIRRFGAEADLLPVAGEEVIRQGRFAAVDPLLAQLRLHLGVGGQQLPVRDRGQGVNVIRSQLLQHGVHDLLPVFAVLRIAEVGRDATHHDALMEQAVRLGNLHHAGHLVAAARLAEQGHVVRVAAEGGNIVMHPLQGGDDVLAARVCAVRILVGVGLQIQIADDVQPVVQRHHHHVAVFAHVRAVKGVLLGGGAHGVAAAVNPYHHGQFGPGVQALGPDVQILAILGLNPLPMGNKDVRFVGFHIARAADRAVVKRGLDAVPGRHGPGLFKAGRRSVADAPEDVGGIQREAFHFSGLGGHRGPFVTDKLAHAHPSFAIVFSRNSFRLLPYASQSDAAASHQRTGCVPVSAMAWAPASDRLRNSGLSDGAQRFARRRGSQASSISSATGSLP